MSESGVALVTGAGQGIGKAIALQLAHDGFDVALNDISPNLSNVDALCEEIKALGRSSSVHIADVSEEEQVQNMVDNVVSGHSSLDVMVANAGIAMYGSIMDTTVNDLDRLFTVNVRGTFLCYKYAAKQMIAQGKGGRIVGASSIAGKGGVANYAIYCGSKFAVRGMTQAAAKEFGQYGITVNAYAPGVIETSMMQQLNEGAVKDEGISVDARMKGLAQRTAVMRNGVPQDVADLVSYLVSKKASFVTGQSVSCNGGTFCD